LYVELVGHNSSAIDYRLRFIVSPKLIYLHLLRHSILAHKDVLQDISDSWVDQAELYTGMACAKPSGVEIIAWFAGSSLPVASIISNAEV
jgi:hypothetical protein